MKYLIDTCGWIEWLTEGKLIKHYSSYFSHVENLIVPTLIQYELYKWISREKNNMLALEIIGITERASVISLETSLALYAADLSKQHKLAMADSIIYATSLKYKAHLVTSDKHFKHLPEITFLQK